MKKFLTFISFLLIITLASCEKPIEQIGTKPTKPFTVSKYIGDNGVYNCNNKLKIYGTSEANVVIKVELINQNGKVVDSYSSTTDEKKLTWVVEMTTPRASDASYVIKIADSFDEYVYEYTNIRFGNLWLVVGETFSNSTRAITLDEELKRDISFYQTSTNEHWLTEDEKELINDQFIIEFANELYDKTKTPVGIILGIKEDASIEEWLPIETINSVDNILKYVKEINKYHDTLEIGDAGYIFETEYKQLEGLSLTGITWNYGINKLSLFDDHSYSTTYFQMLTSLFEVWHNYFNCNNIGVYQTKSSDLTNTSIHRRIQNIGVNYYTYVRLIPIVDIKEDDSFLSSLVERTFDILINRKQISSYANLVFDINNDNIVDKIKIEFNNTEKLIINDNEKIEYLIVKYREDGVDKELDLDIEIEDNYLIFNLAYEIIDYDEDDNEIITTSYYDKKLITIEYAQFDDISKINLFNEDMIPLTPFQITVE